MVRAHELEIGAGRGVDQEQARRRLAARRPQQRRAADLRELDIGEERRRARQARRVENSPKASSAATPSCAFSARSPRGRVEMGARDRRRRGAGLVRCTARSDRIGER